MALAIHFDSLIREGKVKDYAEMSDAGEGDSGDELTKSIA